MFVSPSKKSPSNQYRVYFNGKAVTHTFTEEMIESQLNAIAAKVQDKHRVRLCYQGFLSYYRQKKVKDVAFEYHVEVKPEEVNTRFGTVPTVVEL
jgi:hypothetical protein